MKDFEDCFKKIDKAGTGSLPLSEVGPLLRAVGLNPTLKKIEWLTEWLKANSNFLFNQLIIFSKKINVLRIEMYLIVIYRDIYVIRKIQLLSSKFNTSKIFSPLNDPI